MRTLFTPFFAPVFALVASAMLLAGCASAPSQPELSGTVAQLYNQGMDQLDEHRWAKAAHTFEELQRQYPYSGWATRAQMMSAYAYLKNNDEDAAILTADEFLRLHPGHESMAYMYYLKGIAHYKRMVDVNRDQSNTQAALQAFEEVVNRFPDSIYARDARMKMTLCRDHLAGKEMIVGRYYLERKQYLPAINRFKKVVADYQSTSQTPEALYRLTESYVALGLDDEAKRNAAILQANYPTSSWYKQAYQIMGQTSAGQAFTPATQHPSMWGNLSQRMRNWF